MAIHIGWVRRGWSGLLVAGLSFIAPAMLITGLLGWAYVRFGSVPAAQGLLYGVKPVMLGVILQAIGSRAASLVRVPEGNEVAIKKVLDLGADGVIVPQVNTAQQAADVVGILPLVGLQAGADVVAAAAVLEAGDAGAADE